MRVLMRTVVIALAAAVLLVGIGSGKAFAEKRLVFSCGVRKSAIWIPGRHSERA